MSNTLQEPQTPAEQSEVDYGEHLIWRMVGSKIVTFGANVNGEIFLCTEKDGVQLELIIGTDERGDIALFEVEKTVVAA
jgi:hypothetical protein